MHVRTLSISLALAAVLALSAVSTLTDATSVSLLPAQMGGMMLATLGGLALILAALGIYGVLSYTVGQRTREIGIRMALGADRTQVSRMIVWQALRLTAAGIVVGLFGAFAAARGIASLLFGVQPLDPWTFSATCLLMLATAVLASSAPAWRATRVDPAVALRSE